MLQRVQRSDAHSLVELQHPQHKVLELEVVGRRVAGLAKPTTTRTSRFYAEDIVKSSTAWRLVLHTATFSLSAKPWPSL